MPEIPNVVFDEEVESEWGNLIRDRTVQRYTDATERGVEHTSPNVGDLSYIANTGDVDVYHLGAWRHLGAPAGSMQMLAGGAAPPGWLVCNGALVSRTVYANLFAQIGTAWGAGDGSSTFALPDMRARVPRGAAASGTGTTVGQTFGADTHAHAGPSHVHSVNPPSTNTDTEGSHQHAVGEAAFAESYSGGLEFAQGSIAHDHRMKSSVTGPAPNHNHAVNIGAFNATASGTAATSTVSSIQQSAAVTFVIKT